MRRLYDELDTPISWIRPNGYVGGSALALIFIGVLVATVTVIDPSNVVSTAIYFISVMMLLVMALLSLFTGFKVSFLPFKLCPFIFTTSAVLILIGGLI
jgi:hypothetical protein